MKLNYIGYFWDYDGYGRLNSRLIRALQDEGVEVKPCTMDTLSMPSWMLKQEGVDWDNLTISAFNAEYLQPVPGRHWLLTMVESTRVQPELVERINRMNIERILVPCEHNAAAFRESGVLPPISILPAGTDPDEFYPKDWSHSSGQPYTFVTLADRGMRKGWNEVWDAFYIAFGGKTSGVKDVRLIIKARLRDEPHYLKMMNACEGKDLRCVYQLEDIEDIRSVYEQGDCLALPSRCEGWGMPHREAASMGIPVITQRYSGMDDGHLDEWAIALDHGHMEKMELGEWMVADVGELADAMRWCYENRIEARQFAENGARWIRENQTWKHMARNLINALCMERTTLSLAA